jgi:hypothetical protein
MSPAKDVAVNEILFKRFNAFNRFKKFLLNKIVKHKTTKSKQQTTSPFGGLRGPTPPNPQ